MKCAPVFLTAVAFTTAAFAEPLTIHMGESWAFQVKNGEPVHAHKITQSAKPARGEIGATVGAMAGTTMTLINNSGTGYTYRAELIGAPKATGRTCTLPATNQPTLEYWPQKSSAIRLSGFKSAPNGGSCPQNR